ncbi:MAG TPA: wax ester/triacylglycerol synthase family O-acyltransferase [Acidimicrobiales bacterium]|nr:wax ester/triacylglycerol synthase family O-acyltransferase [Acidimicrobiales bacterium]
MTKFLDPLDSAFLLLETPGTAMNIGAVIELDFGDVADPKERFELMRANVAARLHEIPVLTQRVVRAPLDMTWPILIHDEKFDLHRHVVRVVVPSPGSPVQFDALISEFFSRPLSAQRPLWQLLVIEGLEDGRAALALKVHHALADGVSGAETFANLFDISPEVRAPEPIVELVDEEPTVTTSLGLLRQGIGRVRQRPQLVVDNLRSWGSRLYEIVRALIQVIAVRGRRHATPDQPSIFEARRTSLNGAAGIEKTFHRTRVPLADVKRAAKARGASVTDFVMATTSGALRRLLEVRGEILKRDLIAFVPINVRGAGDTANLGNQISGMLVALHTDIEDPEERLRAISSDANKTLGEQREHRAKIFQDLPRVLGPTLISLGAKLISAFGLFDHLPMANLMISSVPGPPVPLWFSGHRVASAAPVGPLFGAFSLNVTVLGFEQYLEFGLFGCADRMNDMATLRDYMFEEAKSLVASTPG